MNELGVSALSPGSPGFAAAAEQAGGEINWVLTTGGKLLTTPYVEGVTHAATAGGADVLAAGTARVTTAGGEIVISKITALSGHYMNGATAAQSQAAIQAGASAFAGFFTVLSDFAAVFVNPELFLHHPGGIRRPRGGCQMF